MENRKVFSVEMIYIVYEILRLLRYYFRVFIGKRNLFLVGNFIKSLNIFKDMSRNLEYIGGFRFFVRVEL